jgi:hypothetical protein
MKDLGVNNLMLSFFAGAFERVKKFQMSCTIKPRVMVIWLSTVLAQPSLSVC